MAGEVAFETLAEAVLERLAERLEDCLGVAADVDFSGGVLTIALAGVGQYVINKHAPNRQIWVSSPLSGASHYAYRPAEGTWLDTRDGMDLMVRLAEEFGRAAGRPVPLD